MEIIGKERDKNVYIIAVSHPTQWEEFVCKRKEVFPSTEEMGEKLEYTYKNIESLADISSMVKTEEEKKKKSLGQGGIPDPNQGRYRNRQNGKR